MFVFFWLQISLLLAMVSVDMGLDSELFIFTEKCLLTLDGVVEASLSPSPAVPMLCP